MTALLWLLRIVCPTALFLGLGLCKHYLITEQYTFSLIWAVTAVVGTIFSIIVWTFDPNDPSPPREDT